MSKSPSDDDDPDDDERVGYGKPPAHSRFKKGQSGNPSGKKKGTIDLKQTFEDVFSEKFKIIEAGTEKKVSGTHLVVKRLLQNAAKGKGRSVFLSLEYLQRFSNSKTDHVSELPEEDEAILRRSLGGSPESDPSPDQADDMPDDDPGGRDG